MLPHKYSCTCRMLKKKKQFDNLVGGPKGCSASCGHVIHFLTITFIIVETCVFTYLVNKWPKFIHSPLL